MLASSLLLLSLSAAGAEPGPAEPAVHAQARADLDALLVRAPRHPGDDPYADGDPEYRGTNKPGWLLLTTVGFGVVGAITGGKALAMKGNITDATTAEEAEELTRARNTWGYTSLGALGLTATGATVYAAW